MTIQARQGIKSSQRVWFLDNMRYWVAFAVVVFHVALSQTIPAGDWTVNDPRQVHMANWIFTACDIFIMPVFFFIAGYFVLISLNAKGWKRFLTSKIFRLLLPGAMAVVLLNPIFSYIYHVSRSFEAGLPRMSYWEFWPEFFDGGLATGLWRPGDGQISQYTLLHVWFVSYLFLLFVATACIYQVASLFGRSIAERRSNAASYRRIITVFAVTSVVACLLGTAISLVIPNGSWFYSWPWFAVQSPQWFFYICYYLLGMYAYKTRWFDDPSVWRGVPAWSVLCLALVTSYVAGNESVAATPDVAPSFGFTILLWCLRVTTCQCVMMVLILVGLRYFNRPRAIDQHLAANSYRIYMLHITVVAFIQLALLRMPSLSGLAVLWIGIVWSLIASYLVAVAWGFVQRLIGSMPSLWKSLRRLATSETDTDQLESSGA